MRSRPSAPSLAAFALMAAAALAPAPAAAQGLGLGGGLNLSKLVGDDQTVVRSEQRKGLNLGTAFNFGLLGLVSLQPEVYYAQKGQEQEFTDANGVPSGLAMLSLDYIEVPVLAKVSLPGTMLIRPHVIAGPAFAWNIRCNFETRTQDSTEGGDCEGNPTALRFGKADQGIVIGGGARIGLGPVGFVVDARMTRGLKRLQEEAGAGDAKNQVFSFLARFSFGGM